METKGSGPKGPTSDLPAGPEHRRRSSSFLCARCDVAYLVHDRAAFDGCVKFIERGSKEAHQLEAAWAVARATKVADTTRIDDASDLHSDTIDRARLVARDKAQWAAIKKAKGLLLLALDADPTMFKIHCQAALMVLRGIGDA